MANPIKKDTIHAGGIDIGIYTTDFKNEYISLTDIAKYRSIQPSITIHNWLRGRDIVEFLGLWESLHNPNFKLIEFDKFKKDAGTNAFVFSIKDWSERLGAIGLKTKSGRYGGGIYAHIDIAFEFASWISPEFKLYIIKDYQRLKFDENSRLSLRQICSQYEIPIYVERSRSGNGAHIWMFFSDPIPAVEVRKLGSGILTKAMDERHELKFKSYDRMFPNQDNMPKGGFGNLIALPLQGKARQNRNSEFVDESFIPYPDQWEFLHNAVRITPTESARYISELCKNGDMGELVSSNDEKPWEKVCEKPLTPMDFSGTINIVKANMLYIEKECISQRGLNKIKRLAAFKNPEYYKNQKLRLPLYSTPRIIDCSSETDKYLCVPRGCEESLRELLNNANAVYSTKDERNIGRKIDVEFNGKLREEQQFAADEMLRYDNGVLSATTAFGKTVVASFLIAKRKVNTLVLVHSSALLQQWKKALEQFLIFNDELPPTKGKRKKLSHIGQLGSGKNTLNDFVDIAIMQSVVKGEEVKDFVRDYGMVIVDDERVIIRTKLEKPSKIKGLALI